MGDDIDFDDEQTISIIEHFAESLPGGFFIYHADGDESFIYVNKAMLRIFGCDTMQEFKTLTKNSFRTMVHPADIDYVEHSIATQIKNNVHDLDYVEYRIVKKNGEIRWIVDYGHFVHLKKYGDVFYVFVDDATEKQTLKIEEQRKQNVIDGLSSGFNSIYLINTKDDTMMPYAWNDPVSKELVEQTFHNSITETSYTSTIKKFANKYVREEERQNFLDIVELKNIHKKIKNHEDMLHVFRGGAKDDDYVQLTISPVKGTSFLGVMAMKTVTEQMQKIKADALEKLLIEQERDNAIHANNAKSAFLFNMSHDLKTPINAISGFAELARKNMDGDKNRITDYLEKIKSSSDLLVDLINDVLSMTEIESGNLSLEEAPCDLKEQIMLLGDVFKPQISNKNLNYSVTLKIKHDKIIADSLNLKRIFSNILQNAVNFTNEGGEISFIACEESAHPIHDETFNYTFTISDTGVGMSKEFMNRMYKAFEREHNTTTTQISGTGLGLTITKNLVEAMHGSIEATSEAGKGSSFTVHIPFKVYEDLIPEESHETSEKIFSALKNNKSEKPRRILLVEDNALNREIALEIVKDIGLEAEVALDGKQAVDIFKNNEENFFNLILMDIQMPVMNGYEATREIRALERADAKEIPIFALTANTMEADKIRAINSGMNEVIAKPVDISFLENLLSRL